MMKQTTGVLHKARAILFDLDDTLVSFDEHCRPSWSETCALFAPEAGLPAETLHDAISRISRAYWNDRKRHREGRLDLEETRRRLVTQALAKLGESAALATRLADHYSNLQESRIALYEDSLATLDYFKRRGVTMGLVTNGNSILQWRKIKRFNLEQYFGCCRVEGDLGFGKPDARIFTGALEALGVQPHETWCVGDNLEWDIEGAQACGITAVWKDTKRTGLPSNGGSPDHIITDIAELIKLWDATLTAHT